MLFELSYQIGTGRQKIHRVTSGICCVGSARNNDLVLSSAKVAKRHAQFRLAAGGVEITDLGSSGGTWVNRQRVRQFTALSELDDVVLGDVNLRLLTSLPVSGAAVEGGLTGQVANAHKVKSIECAQADIQNSVARQSSEQADLAYWGGIVHEQLISQMDLRRKDVNRMSDDQLRSESVNLLEDIIAELIVDIPSHMDVSLLKRHVLNEAVGLGPLEKYLEDDSISEIMVNSHTEIFVERAGKLERSDYSFSSEHAVYAVIERIITPLGRRIDEGSPIVDARLSDGSRVNAIIPPLALKGPTLTVRKFPRHSLQFTDLLQSGSVSEPIVDFLQVCVEQCRNVIVSGGTGSGKTTLLNALSDFIPRSERVITIEDAAELKLSQPNLVALESRPANIEDKGTVSIRDLVRNALRMRPDRIVVGECRGPEAIDMLQAMNTGHDGSLTTLHANNPRDVISRLEVLVLMTGMDLPVTAIREQIASAVNIIVQQTRYPCGSRKVSKVTEVVGIESGTVQLQDIFAFEQQGLDSAGRVRGQFVATGFIPSFYENLRAVGLDPDLSYFDAARTCPNET